MVLINIVLLNGCATLNEDQCRVADWYQIGFTDGSNGEPENYLQKHQKACAKHGVNTNLNEWLQGREAGLKRYCTAARGFQEGLKNHTYHGVCVGEAGFKFESAYQDGQTIYQQQKLIEGIEEQIDDINDELEDLDDEWQALKHQLIHSKLTERDRADIIDRMDDIKDQIADLNAQREYLAGRLDHELYILDDMQRSM